MMIDELDLTDVAVERTTQEVVKQAIAREFWLWYKDHENDEIWTANLWMIHKTFRVSDLHPVFVKLFGYAFSA